MIANVITVVFVVFAVFGCGVILSTVISRINEEIKDEHEEGGF